VDPPGGRIGKERILFKWPWLHGQLKKLMTVKESVRIRVF